jgi:hypothetical protein
MTKNNLKNLHLIGWQDSWSSWKENSLIGMGNFQVKKDLQHCSPSLLKTLENPHYYLANHRGLGLIYFCTSSKGSILFRIQLLMLKIIPNIKKVD